MATPDLSLSFSLGSIMTGIKSRYLELDTTPRLTGHAVDAFYYSFNIALTSGKTTSKQN
jgi:hypothetical protein